MIARAWLALTHGLIAMATVETAQQPQQLQTVLKADVVQSQESEISRWNQEAQSSAAAKRSGADRRSMAK